MKARLRPRMKRMLERRLWEKRQDEELIRLVNIAAAAFFRPGIEKMMYQDPRF